MNAPAQLVHVSTVEVDVRFVAKTISERKLEPIPLANFTESDDWHCENHRWKRVFERYSWGGVLFISDRDEDEHYTMVLEGEVDLGAGFIRRGDGVKESFLSGIALANGNRVPYNAQWYQRMAIIFSESLQKSGRSAKVPPCLGSYQGDHVCDGGYNPRGQMEAACAWRERCILVQGLCAREKKTPDDVLRNLSTEDIIRLTSRLMSTQPAVSPPVALRAPAVPAIATVPVDAVKAKNVVRKSVNKIASPRTGAAAEYDFTLPDAIKSAIANKLVSLKIVDRESAQPGDLYFRKAASYESLMLKKSETDKGADRGVFTIMWQKSATVSLRFAVDFNDAILSGISGVENMTKPDGQFISQVKRLVQSDLGVIVEVLSKLVLLKAASPKN